MGVREMKTDLWLFLCVCLYLLHLQTDKRLDEITVCECLLHLMHVSVYKEIFHKKRHSEDAQTCHVLP